VNSEKSRKDDRFVVKREKYNAHPLLLVRRGVRGEVVIARRRCV